MALKALIVMVDGLVFQLRERNVGFSTRGNTLNTALATNRT